MKVWERIAQKWRHCELYLLFTILDAILDFQGYDQRRTQSNACSRDMISHGDIHVTSQVRSTGGMTQHVTIGEQWLEGTRNGEGTMVMSRHEFKNVSRMADSSHMFESISQMLL